MKMGGDRRSQRIEAHAAFLLEKIKTKPDTTIMELRDKLRERHGLSFGYATVWRFLVRHRITRKNAQEEEGGWWPPLSASQIGGVAPEIVLRSRRPGLYRSEESTKANRS